MKIQELINFEFGFEEMELIEIDRKGTSSTSFGCNDEMLGT
jgi:hypothetical protein